MSNERQRANEVALSFDCYFECSDLEIRLGMEGIDPQKHAAETLDSLQDAGLVSHQEVGKDIWVYRSNISFDPNSENQQKVSREIRRRELGIYLVK